MERLFEQICNMSISASWLILAVLTARFLIRKAPKKYACLLWLLVGIRLVLPFSIESAWSLVPAVDMSAISALTEETPTEPEVKEELAHPIVSEGFNPYDYEVGGTYHSTGVMEVTSDAETTDAMEPRTLPLIEILSYIWLAGIAVMLCYFFGSLLYLRNKLSVAVILKENVWQSEWVDSPFIFGVIDPRIYIPYHLTEENLEYVLAHEKAHIKRRDHWTKVIAFLLLSVYWFHPMVWLSYAFLCKDIEMACDEQVVVTMNEENRKAYSLALLSCHGKQNWYHACPIGFGEVNVKERIIRVLNYRKPSFWMILTAIVLGILISVCFLTNAEKKEETAVEAVSEEQAETQVYGKVSFGDLNYNGKEDYYTYYANEEEKYHGQMIFYMDEEPIYTYDSEYQISQAKVEYVDVDADYRKELFVTWVPSIDSGRLMEYFILDKTTDGWRTLEMPYRESVHQNAFPISMVYGAEAYTLAISCEGSDAILFFDLKEHYEKAIAGCEEGSEERQIYQDVLDGKNYVQGESFGGISGKALYSVRTGMYRQESSPGSGFYDDYPCMIASHRLEGIGGEADYLGNLHVYYQYDKDGNVEIWNLKLGKNEMKTLNPDNYFLSLPEADLTVYYDEKEGSSCQGIYLKKENAGQEGIAYFPWEYLDQYSYSSEVSLLHNDQYCLFEFTQGTGEQVHIVDLQTMKEIPIQSAEDVITEYFKTELMDFETGEIRFRCQGESIAETADPKYMDRFAFPELSYGNNFDYEIEGDTLMYRSYLEAGNSYVIGELRLKYVYRDGMYQMDSLIYQSLDTYLMPDEVSRNQNEVRMSAYRKAIWFLRDEYVFPNGRYANFTYGNWIEEGNGYHMRDIDNDGRIELIIHCPDMDILSDGVFYVFEYDVNTKQFHEQLGIKPSVTLYHNGIVVAGPYEVYQYQENTDTYELIDSMNLEEYELWKENALAGMEPMKIKYEKLSPY